MRIGKRFNTMTSDINLNGKVINWCSEIKYLRVYISAATTFKYDLHNAKMKFVRCWNGLLSKLGSSPHVGVTLYFISTKCNPILIYGLESMRLSKANYNSISYPYNSAYQVRSGCHPKGPFGHGCCSDVLPPFSVSNQLLESNSVSSCGNAMQ